MRARGAEGVRRRPGPPWDVAALALVLVALVLALPHAGPLFAALFPEAARPVYERASFAALALAHLGLVAASSLAAVLVGGGIGLLVSRGPGKALRGLADSAATIGQAVPPVAVLALSVPALGYGAAPTLAALALYGLLPVLSATVAGLGAVPEAAREAARGLGYGPWGRLLAVDLPLAAPVALAGVRTSVIVNIGTATVGSTVGALTLGSPIIEGLSGGNTAYVVQGALVVGVMALTVDRAFEALARRLPEVGNAA